MSPDDRIRIFKEVARDYQKYVDQIARIDEKLEELRIKMEGVHSINLEKEPSSPSFNERPLVEMIERKALYEKEKQYYNDLIGWVHEVIDSFESPAIKALVWMTYVQKRSLTSVSDEYMISKDNLYKIRRKHLGRVLNDELIDKIELIRKEEVRQNDSI